MKFVTAFFAAALLFAAAVPGTAFAYGHDRQLAAAGEEHAELVEPLFTDKPFTEKELEYEGQVLKKAAETEYENALGLSWVFLERLQLGFEVPYVMRDPKGADGNQSDLGDVAFSAKYLVYRAPENGFAFSLAGEVAAPSGNEDKEIDEKGSWAVFANAASAIRLAGLPEIGLFGQIGWQQQIRLTKEQKETAETDGVAAVHQKDFLWRLAATTTLADGRIMPTLEILGTTTVDVIGEEGTVVELGGGVWTKPFDENDGALEPLSVGLAAKGPLTNREDAEYVVRLIVKYEFD